MGGGDFTVPVQRVTDFLESKLSGKQPVSFHTQFTLYLFNL